MKEAIALEVRIPVIQVHPKDNVGVACVEVPAGALFSWAGGTLTTRMAIPAGHKVALAQILAGGTVIKHGEGIGQAIQLIQAGDHVHLHNLRSLRTAESPSGERWEGESCLTPPITG